MFSRAALIAASMLSGGVALAQDSDGIDIERFRPNADGYGYFGMDSAATLDNLQLGLGFWGNYSNDPLTLDLGGTRVSPGAADGDDGDGLVDNRFRADLQVGMGISRFFSFTVDLPLVLAQDGFQASGLSDLTEQPVALDGGGLGDVTIRPKIVGMDRRRGPMGLALAIPVSVPTGDGNVYNGEGGVTLTPTAIVELSDGAIQNRDYKFRAALNLGYKFRPADRIRDVSVTNEAVYGVGLGLHPADPLELVLEFAGGIFGPRPEQQAAEALLGAKILAGRFVTINLGGGMGLMQGLGSPDYRLVGGFTVAPPFDPNARDQDGDGVADGMDQCKDQAEDRDGFKDDDGCPDLDNDVDGIPDDQDQCPNDAEDDDGWMDNDGCPEKDNDKDGVDDINDRCPDEAETVNDYMDDDGCPDDKPIDDTDGDGYKDDIDRCPYDAEDFDQFEDEDGCPEKDNDNDGILDEDDQCPLVREIINGVEDSDGCPDEGRVVVDKSSIKIADRIYFDFGKTSIQAVSTSLIDEIAAVIVGNPDLKKIRVEGHTDNVGSDVNNLKLSQGRADSVKAALIARGVDASRLDAVGFGEMRPIDSNDNEEGRQNNRRVEFIIVERN